MSIIWFLLKTIGIVLLVLIGLIVLLLGLILLVPIHYEVSGNAEESIRLDGSIHWLCHILSFCISYQDGKTDYYLKLFGIRKSFSETDAPETETEPEHKQKKKFKKKSKKKNNAADFEETKPPEQTAENTCSPTKEPECIEAAAEEETASDPENPEKKERDSNDYAGMDSDSEGEPNKKDGWFQKAVQKGRGFKEALHRIPETKERIKAVLTDESNKQAVHLLWKELRYLLHHIRFRKIRTDLSFSLGDPSLTGQVLGVLCMLPAMYRYQIHVYPDFETDKLYAKGSFQVKGHVRFVHSIISLVRLLTAKDIRTILKRFLKK